MKKRLTRKERVIVAITTFASLAAGFFPILIRAAGTPQSSTPAVNVAAYDAIALPLRMRVTAFSSSIDETDDTPFYTANGTHVRDGIVATNLLPFGTRIQIPDLFGEKTFTVEDRMAKHFKNTIDIWMSSKTAALHFGVSYADVVIVPGGANQGISER